ncbi:MAG: HD domain-containing protein [Bdellovibrionaceae bacterium]|nr:HD domain-containing protein [Pseudobdellovibrionaceae bacterium]
MSRSFLNDAGREEGRRRLRPPSHAPDGESRADGDFVSREFSDWLLRGLLEEWRRHPDFERAAPVLVGSAARRELTPRSDLDLLFTGPEEAVRSFVGSCQQKGLRIRARVPENPEDWTVGVEVWDWLALFEARVLVPAAEDKLLRQREILARRASRERRSWLKVILKERRERQERYDSIANVLEPNLKYGPGGLRDLDQARQIARLFPERFIGEDFRHALGVLEYYAAFWTLLRQKLHLEGQGDVLMNASQFDLAAWFGMQHKTLMREIQRGLSRVSFYAEWIAEQAGAGEKRLSALRAVPLKTRAQAMRALEKDPSVLMQSRIRQKLDELFPLSWVKAKPRERGRCLERVLRPGASAEFIVAVFASRLIDRLCPEIVPLVGYVQHDQYHRYTADIHLQQACRQFQGVLRKPRRLGRVGKEVTALSAADQKILSWTVLYHDLMKGREGDHSALGRDLVRRDLRQFGQGQSLITEVEWLVENHLALSQAAFRKNPAAPSTWSELREMGAQGARLRRLAVFTAVDIFATNPEAWTPWKARLMSDLLKALRSPSAKVYFRLQQELAKRGIADRSAEIDDSLILKLPAAKLAEDLAEVSRPGPAQKPKVLSIGRGEVWIRFHEREDHAGIFAEYVQRLYSMGLSVRHASVHTLPGIGVYDWFQVSSRRSLPQIRQWLAAEEWPVKPPPKVKFEKVSLVSQDENEWVLSFKGLDQPGCLAAAALALSEAGMSLRSARVHTWGRQVDDLFHIVPRGDVADLLAGLRRRFEEGP